MLKTYDRDVIEKSRTAFIHNRSFTEEAVRAEILASWQRCRELNLDPAVPPAVTGAGEVCVPKTLVPSFLQDSLFQEFNGYLDQMGAAFFFILEDGSVLYSAGNEELRARLAGMQVNDCTLFRESNLGTNAVSLCQGAGLDEAWVRGAEHYLDCLTPFTTYARWEDNSFSRYVMCIIAPQENFSDAFLIMTRYFMQLRRLSSELYNKNIELAKSKILFNQLKDIQSDALMLVDYSQHIICVNNAFEALFDLSEDDLAGRGLIEIFPELESFASSLFTGQGSGMSEIAFEGLPAKKKTLYVTCTPWKHNDILNGMVISLTRNKGEKKNNECVVRNKEGYSFDELIGKSAIFQETKSIARSVAKGGSSIILTGESGTGKELFAKAIHNASLRNHKPFVAVNCSAIPKDLIGSELFGYGDGAFTGARKGGSMGKFEYAHGGTLFLDEVAELPLEVQAILLRVLEERTVVRIGTNTVIPVDVRIVSATNKNLMHMVRDKQFRLDLYYRLNVISIELPPLNKRPEDISLLVNHYLDKMSTSMGKHVTHVSPEVMACLVGYPWPGNVRQLKNVIERGVSMTDSFELRMEDMPKEICNWPEQEEPAYSRPGQHPGTSGAQPGSGGKAEVQNYSEWERERIWDLMQKYRANKSRIAAELGISRGTLYKKIREYKL